jgi:hypothetical protein
MTPIQRARAQILFERYFYFTIEPQRITHEKLVEYTQSRKRYVQEAVKDIEGTIYNVIVKKASPIGVYSAENLTRVAHTMNYRQLDINHEEHVPYPENHAIEFGVQHGYLVGAIFLSDPKLIEEVENGSIYSVSLETLPDAKRTRLYYFTSLALVRRPFRPKDPYAVILTRS